MLQNTTETYGFLAKILHWGMAGLFIIMYVIGFVMINMSDADTYKWTFFDFHKATGLLLFVLVAGRLIWRSVSLKPSLPNTLPFWQRALSHLSIVALYVLMIVMPITGFLTSTLGNHPITFYGLFTIKPLANNPGYSEFFANAHEILAYALIAFFVIHVLGALYHHYILKDHVLKRMWFRKKTTY